MNYIFDVEVAREYGVNEAIFISNLQFWIAKNKANGIHYHGNRTWTYNSNKAYLFKVNTTSLLIAKKLQMF